MIVAQITKDHLPADDGYTQKDRQFDYASLVVWWGWDDLPSDPDWMKESDRTTFKMYDDDDELYYEGWLINDNQGLVQQFVLDWGKSYAGCTLIKVHKPSPVPGFGGGEYVQEIG